MLDSHTISKEKSKSINSAMMHSLYAIADIGNGKELIKLFVEELNDINSDGTIKRAYQLQNIENQQLSDRVQNNVPSSLTNTIGNVSTVSDLFALVKQNNKNFKSKDCSLVLNEDGAHKIMYHGTNIDWNAYDLHKNRNQIRNRQHQHI